MKARIVVGAHYGLKDWLAQRVTAVVMAIYTMFIGLAFVAGAGNSYENWHVLMSNTFVRFLSFLFIVSLCYHAWIGVRDIWMDYVQPVAVRLTLHVLTILALVGYAGWAVQILWRL
jgi:succinate dehydrogenase / fumarate reductase, membrane anchor subunit